MSQHDMEIANQGFPAFRSDLNDSLQALASNSSGATEPTTTYAHQMWYDSTANLLKMRNADDDAWITLAYFDQTNDEWEVRSAVIQAVDSAGVVIKTDDGTTRLTVADDGSITTQGDLTVGGDLDVSSGTIKLDGNYPVGTQNVALGDTALDSVTSAQRNTAIGNAALTATTTGSYNVGIGHNSFASNTTGASNVAVGDNTFSSNVDGNNNSVLGQGALRANTSGDNNVAVGLDAMRSNTTASNNTAVGYQSLYANTTGTYNVAMGAYALDANTTASGNSAFGYLAMTTNTTGEFNTAIGRETLEANTTADNNTAVGFRALTANTTASNNTAVGYSALGANTTGTHNVAIGKGALAANTTSGNSVAVGSDALPSSTGASNTAIGRQAGYSTTTTVDNTFIGTAAGFGATGGDNTFIGSGSGYSMTTGQKNTIIGRYNGNQNGLDIRTSSNNIVLSDGDGNPRMYWESSGCAVQQGDASNRVVLDVINTRTGTYGSAINVVARINGTPDNNISKFFQGQDATTPRFIVWSDGDVDNHDNSYGGISDERLKEQIIDASSQWDDIKALNVRKFKFKSDVAEKGDSDEHWRLGVIAQEVESAGMGGLVRNSPVYEDGEDTGEVEKSVKYSILYMKAVKALQEAMERIETLEAKVNALENA